MINFSKFNSIISLTSYFTSDAKCMQAIIESRWGVGEQQDVVCPYCGKHHCKMSKNVWQVPVPCHLQLYLWYVTISRPYDPFFSFASKYDIFSKPEEEARFIKLSLSFSDVLHPKMISTKQSCLISHGPWWSVFIILYSSSYSQSGDLRLNTSNKLLLKQSKSMFCCPLLIVSLLGLNFNAYVTKHMT